MEREAVLFKRFAGIDCFDIEVDETHTHVHAEPIARHLADTIAAAPRQVRRFGLAPYFAL